jgi:uncharacterized protein YggE
MEGWEAGEKMMTRIFRCVSAGATFAGITLALMLFAGVARAQTSASTEVPAIVTPGEAIVKQAPDQAWVTVVTDARAPKPADARRLGAQAMTDVQAALKATGLAADAIRTRAFSLQPEMQWQNGRSSIIGYIAHNEIEVRVDDLDKLPDVLDAANTPKGVSLTIEGPRFDVKAREALERQALTKAVENAMSRAQAMAAGARLTLGSIVRIENQTMSSQPMPMPRAMTAMASAAPEPRTPIVPGEIEIRAQVTLSVSVR